MTLIFSLLAGVIFGVGLTLSDMVNPARVLNFLDVAGNWDPTLMFVMAGGLAVTTLGYRWIFRRPLACGRRQVPSADPATDRLAAGRRRRAVWRGLGPRRHLPRSGPCRSRDLGTESPAVCCRHAGRDDCSGPPAKQGLCAESPAAIVGRQTSRADPDLLGPPRARAQGDRQNRRWAEVSQLAAVYIFCASRDAGPRFMNAHALAGKALFGLPTTRWHDVRRSGDARATQGA